MKAIRMAVALGFAGVLCGGCGRKGDILPPLVLVPQTIETLKTGQRSDRVILEWTAPAVFIDGRPLPPSAVSEIWVLRNSAAESAVPRDQAVEGFMEKAQRLAALDVYGRPILKDTGPGPIAPLQASALREFHWEWTMTPEDWKAARLIFGVRVKAGKKGFSEFSYMGWWPRKIPMPPDQLRANVYFDRLEIRWTPPTANTDGTKPPLLKGYNIYRNSPAGVPQRLNNSPVAANFFMDRTFEFGLVYNYRVLALTGDSPPFIESEDSAVLEITPVDKYPPSPPAGLASVPALDLITLIWEPSPEADVAGYRVWRRLAGETEFRALTPAAIAENTFVDTAVEKGRRYEYAVSAVDRKGNESPRTAAIAEIIKDSRI